MGYNFKELEELVRINSYTKNKEGVDRNGELMREKFEKLGYKTTIFKREKFGGRSLGTIYGLNLPKKRVKRCYS